jgi:general nucleoside transport system ATP-binding protein
MSIAVELRGIVKNFGAIRANDGVDMAIPEGSITGIVGENGAGKSTAMNIVYGLYRPDGGEILIDGRTVRHESPAHAIGNHIGMVHQHFMLVETFTVLENVVLGAERGGLLKKSLDHARAELARLSREYGLAVSPDAKISNLPVGDQQRVEILKALYRGARILILDEPTAVLTPQETEQFFRILGSLKQKGTTIILITHKLKEIMAVTDQVYVMRAGKVVARRDTSGTDQEELAELMVGRKVRLKVEKTPAEADGAALSVEHLSLSGEGGVPKLNDISFVLRSGEIVGIAGVSGNGQSELMEILAGIRAPTSGRFVLDGRTIDRHHPAGPAEMRKLGLAHVPEDRLRFAMAARFTAAEVGILGYQRRAPFTDTRGLLDRAAIVAHCRALMERYDVRPRKPQQLSGQFSGGNQQKLIIARETADAPRVLLAGQPARGVDIGAIAFIHSQLVALRDGGCAILLVSSELDEIMALADRILVMCGGRIAGEVAGADADETTLGRMMGGLGNDSVGKGAAA